MSACSVMTTPEAIALSIVVGLALAAIGFWLGRHHESKRLAALHARDIILYTRALNECSKNIEWVTAVLAETHADLATKEAELARCRKFIREAFGDMPESKEASKWTN